MKTAHVFVTGRVQGVFYRAWTRENAQKLGLNGWVRNLRDGRVEAIIQGEQKKVQEMLDRMENGSRAADVDDLRYEYIESEDNFSGFEIRT